MRRLFTRIMIPFCLILLVACNLNTHKVPVKGTESISLDLDTNAPSDPPNTEEPLYSKSNESEFIRFKAELVKENNLLITIKNRDGEMLTLLDDAIRYRTILDQCEWGQGLGECLPDGYDYTLILHFRDYELKLFSGSTVAAIVENERISIFQLVAPMNYPYSNGSVANQIRCECFDAAEVRMLLEDIQIDDDALAYVAEQYNRQVNDCLKGLFAGSSMGIEDYVVRITEVVSYNEDKTKLVFYAENALKPNEIQSLIWWAGGSDIYLGTGELDGFIIKKVYYELELLDGKWVSTAISRKDAIS